MHRMALLEVAHPAVGFPLKDQRMRTPKALIALFAFTLLLPPALRAQAGRIPVPAEEGMVASSHHLASRAGSEVLRALAQDGYFLQLPPPLPIDI